jgi:hypothetical protein
VTRRSSLQHLESQPHHLWFKRASFNPVYVIQQRYSFWKTPLERARESKSGTCQVSVSWATVLAKSVGVYDWIHIAVCPPMPVLPRHAILVQDQRANIAHLRQTCTEWKYRIFDLIWLHKINANSASQRVTTKKYMTCDCVMPYSKAKRRIYHCGPISDEPVILWDLWLTIHSWKEANAVPFIRWNLAKEWGRWRWPANYTAEGY